MQAMQSEESLISHEGRLSRTEAVIEHINYMLERIDKRIDLTNQQASALSFQVEKGNSLLNDKIDSVINRLEGKVDTNFKWIVGMMITLFVLNSFVPLISKWFLR